MKIVFYNCLFGSVDLPEPTDKIIYSYLVYKSLAAIDNIFVNEYNEFDYLIAKEYMDENNDLSFYGFSYSKTACDLNMSVNTIKSRINYLSMNNIVNVEDKYVYLYLFDEIKDSFYFELQISSNLKGETLIVYSYLKHKSKNMNNIISTYDKPQSQELKISKKHYQKILCQLYKLGLAERLENGRLKIN